MSTEVNSEKNLLNLFGATAQTYQEAEQKKAEESTSFVKIERYQMDSDGTYNFRILPLAPKIDSEGNALPSDRKGYEYPLKSLWLSVENRKEIGRAHV